MPTTLTYSAPSVWLVYGMFFLPIVVVIALNYLVIIAHPIDRDYKRVPFGLHAVPLRFGIGCAVIMVLLFLLGVNGVMREWDSTVPPLILLILGSSSLALALTISKTGNRLAMALPSCFFVLLQLFRLPLELLLYLAAIEGVMPNHLSFKGMNWDIITGITALPIYWLAVNRMFPKWALFLWNLIGSILLLTSIGASVASTPMVAAFGPNRLNIWIADAPFIWLPGILMPIAMFSHLLIWRKLIFGTVISVKLRFVTQRKEFRVQTFTVD